MDAAAEGGVGSGGDDPAVTLSRRKPWIAVVLSILGVGVGHLYCGRLARALAFVAASQVGLPAILVLTVAPPSDAWFQIVLALALATPVVTLVGAVDAWRIARHSVDGAPPRAFQRPAVYALAISTIVLGSWTAALVARRFLLEAFLIPTRGMEPTLSAGDRFLVNKLRFALQPIGRGDVVTFRSSEDPGAAVHVQRVIGLPGDVVEGRGGLVLVNGEPLPLESADGDPGEQRERIGGRTHLVRPGADFRATTVPEGALFLLGDNRLASRDSRHVGPIPESAVGGRVEYLFIVGEDWHRLGAINN